MEVYYGGKKKIHYEEFGGGPICIIFQLSSHKSRNIVFFEAH